MIRKILLHLLPFVLPFLVYGIYVLISRRAEARGEAFRHAPWYWLSAVGLCLSIASFLFLGVLDQRTDGHYVPAQIIDGKVVPGRFEN